MVIIPALVAMGYFRENWMTSDWETLSDVSYLREKYPLREKVLASGGRSCLYLNDICTFACFVFFLLMLSFPSSWPPITSWGNELSESGDGVFIASGYLASCESVLWWCSGYWLWIDMGHVLWWCLHSQRLPLWIDMGQSCDGVFIASGNLASHISQILGKSVL